MTCVRCLIRAHFGNSAICAAVLLDVTVAWGDCGFARKSGPLGETERPLLCPALWPRPNALPVSSGRTGGKECNFIY